MSRLNILIEKCETRRKSLSEVGLHCVRNLNAIMSDENGLL